VGIGTDSPAVKLEVNGDGLQLRLDGTANTSRGILLRSTGTAEGQIQTDGNLHFIQEDAGKYMRFSTANTERMRIDSSGNVLVGKTAVSLGAVGVEVKPNGEVRATASEAQALQLNRLSSDGTIADFRKDGTTVGSIGVNSTTPYMSGNLGGFRLTSSAGAGVMIPTDTSGNASDADNDLGISSIRWRDLYLSSGVYLGGTGAANKLDDFETGSWTPTFGATSNPTMGYNSQAAVYTKVGNLVSVTCKIITTSRSGGSGQLTVDGLPFTVAANVDCPIYIGFNYNWTTPPNGGSCQQNTTHVLLYSSIANNTASAPVDIVASGNSYLIFSATYRTNS
jgi:hypothetical protein